MLEVLRAVFATLAVRAQCKVIRLLCVIDNPVTVHCAIPLGGGSVLNPDDTIGFEDEETLAPWREA